VNAYIAGLRNASLGVALISSTPHTTSIPLRICAHDSRSHQVHPAPSVRLKLVGRGSVSAPIARVWQRMADVIQIRHMAAPGAVPGGGGPGLFFFQGFSIKTPAPVGACSPKCAQPAVSMVCVIRVLLRTDGRLKTAGTC